jgi:hypothetical protein
MREASAFLDLKHDTVQQGGEILYKPEYINHL